MTTEKPVAPRRYGLNYFPGSLGLSFMFSWSGTFYEDYGFKRKIKYLDIRIHFLGWTAFWQIPLKKYGVKGIVRENQS